MRDEDIPDINNPKTMEAVLEGDKLMKEVLNGGYNVHPVPPLVQPVSKGKIQNRLLKVLHDYCWRTCCCHSFLGFSWQVLKYLTIGGPVFYEFYGFWPPVTHAGLHRR